MKKWFKRIFLKIYITFHTWMLRFGIAMHNTEQDVLKADPNGISEKSKHNIRKSHSNPAIEKMAQGERDEQYVKDFYEILKKADYFLKTSSPEKIAMSADKFGMNLGKKDRWGRRYDHFGFYDPKHKNYGKTLAEAMKDEVLEKTTKDDDYEVEFMFDNKPIESGFSGLSNLKPSSSESVESGVEVMNEIEKAKVRKFPMTVTRKNEDVANKIEQLTSFLHVKKVAANVKILEFFIPKKFKLKEHLKDEIILKELTDIEIVFIKDEYDGRYGYAITEYYKYLDHDDNYDVLKFKSTTIENIN